MKNVSFITCVILWAALAYFGGLVIAVLVAVVNDLPAGITAWFAGCTVLVWEEFVKPRMTSDWTREKFVDIWYPRS